MRAPEKGQAGAEYLLCVGVLALALFAPVIEGTSVVSYLARQLVAWFQGLYALLSLS